MTKLTNWTEMTRDELREAARADGLKVAGTKAELVERLADFEQAGIYNEHQDGHHEDAPDESCEACQDEASEESKTTKQQATRKGGRTLIPGYTMNQARTIVADFVAERIAGLKGDDPVDVIEQVESVLMDAADDKAETGTSVLVDYGRVMNEYLRQDRRDRYDYMLAKLNQAVGRELKARGIDRRTGRPSE